MTGYDAYVESCAKFNQDFIHNNKVLIRYVRGRTGKKGVVVAYKNSGGQICVGYSLCCKRDTFNRDIGLKLAITRAVPISLVASDSTKTIIPYSTTIPHSIYYHVKEMVLRAKQYFKM